ncbi:MAG: MOSC domain-containing protein [Gemmatimonadetes bacterium]|nr:MOSC domain-containing protein [Gemmatimonadota bacterium]NIR78761.1 MOSC domain-containing protein [Gemmatimonadota bacterium]NIT87397.1 MOSC domain-containing protein [Gemmatimonadota bacterium]NIU31250.1 MOSC domain-containing protein [Gemmatimonadota bacterium]NIU35960.1 MOSC domain-containing protein [Gemmatimonadota bacterium]
MSAAPSLTRLTYYPVKSCRGVALDRAVVGPRGIRGDRRWMVVDAGGRFLSQRSWPRMCLIRPRPLPGGLRLDAPRAEPLLVEDGEQGRTRVTVEIWGHRTEAVDAGTDAARWFSDFLGVSCRLVRHADDALRRVDPDYARSDADQVGCADGFPFLLTSETSLSALNDRLPEPLPMDRFRPNLVVAGTEAFAEDAWETIRVGDVVFSVVKPCTRCSITTVNQETGDKGEEPLKTLADFRRGPGGVEFGQNLIHHGTGTLETGDEVRDLAPG